MTQPLSEGEHVDLDSGLTIKRNYRANFVIHDGMDDIHLTRDDIMDIAKLAGVEVRFD